MTLATCCCCLSLRTGAIGIAVLGIVDACVGITLLGVVDACVNLSIDCRHLFRGIHMEFKDEQELINICLWIRSVLQFMASSCLLFGAVKREKVSTTIYLVLEMISVVMCTIVTGVFAHILELQSYYYYHYSPTNTMVKGAFASGALLFVIGLALPIYYCICVFGFLKELRGSAFCDMPQLYPWVKCCD